MVDTICYISYWGLYCIWSSNCKYNKFIMTQEDKELLLQDLCGRLPYGVKMNHIADTENNPIALVGIAKTMITLESSAGYETSDIEDYIPYLFPLSSMTEEQYGEYTDMGYSVTERWWSMANYHQIDWCNKNHFDYRGLIEKGLAIDCTGLNIY